MITYINLKGNLFKYCLILIFVCSIIGCSADLSSDKLKINVEFQKIDSWLNLMPGSGHKFFIAGKFSIINNSDSTIKKIDLQQIKIYQDENLIYSFTPLVNDMTMTESTDFLPGQIRNFVFGTDPGLKQKDELDLDKNIWATFVFTSGVRYIEFTSSKMKIEKVY